MTKEKPDDPQTGEQEEQSAAELPPASLRVTLTSAEQTALRRKLREKYH